MNAIFHPQTLPEKTSRLLQQFAEKVPDFLSSFYLSGGTALSLQLGHRESEDLDFFSEQSFDPEVIERQLHPYGTLSETELAKSTLNTYLNGVKLQFLLYPYRLIEPLAVWEEVNLSSIIDIACTKLQTIGMRGGKKDFVDIYFLLQRFTLPELLEYTRKKYLESDYSETHILKSMVYFDDAEVQPMPRMHQDVTWDQVKETLVAVIKSVPLTQ